MVKNYFLCFILIFLGITRILASTLDSTTENIILKFHQFGSNYYTYPTPKEKYTKEPNGYKPFYLSHYGRHGSRFHQPAEHYFELYNILLRADSLKALTEIGKSLLQKVIYLKEYAAPRAGDLTQLGVQQHQEIAQRMVKNFPELFKKDAYIEAYASTSVRCVVSMAAFLEELKAQKPSLNIHQESGKYLMSFLNPINFGQIIDESNTKKWQAENEQLYKKINPMPMMMRIFNDSNYVKNNIQPYELHSQIYEIGNNLQNSPEIEFDLYNLWTKEELENRWKAQNAWWYSVLGNNPFSKKEGLDNGKPLLKNIIDIADQVISNLDKKNKISATLRFGHDTAIIPLTALLALEKDSLKAGIETSDMENLSKFWRDYEISPMAANVQFIFYKSLKKNEPILVKVLLNEIEQILPVPCNILKKDETFKEGYSSKKQSHKQKCPSAPYYQWTDFKEYYQKIIDK